MRKYNSLNYNSCSTSWLTCWHCQKRQKHIFHHKWKLWTYVVKCSNNRLIIQTPSIPKWLVCQKSFHICASTISADWICSKLGICRWPSHVFSREEQMLEIPFLPRLWSIGMFCAPITFFALWQNIFFLLQSYSREFKSVNLLPKAYHMIKYVK